MYRNIFENKWKRKSEHDTVDNIAVGRQLM